MSVKIPSIIRGTNFNNKDGENDINETRVRLAGTVLRVLSRSSSSRVCKMKKKQAID